MRKCITSSSYSKRFGEVIQDVLLSDSSIHSTFFRIVCTTSQALEVRNVCFWTILPQDTILVFPSNILSFSTATTYKPPHWCGRDWGVTACYTFCSGYSTYNALKMVKGMLITLIQEFQKLDWIKLFIVFLKVGKLVQVPRNVHDDVI